MNSVHNTDTNNTVLTTSGHLKEFNQGSAMSIERTQTNTDIEMSEIQMMKLKKQLIPFEMLPPFVPVPGVMWTLMGRDKFCEWKDCYAFAVRECKFSKSICFGSFHGCGKMFCQSHVNLVTSSFCNRKRLKAYFCKSEECR